MMGYAVTRFWFPDKTGGEGDETFSQVQYMREVRLRNAEGIANSY